MADTPFYALLWLFFTYSLLGWCAETIAAVLHRGRLLVPGIGGCPFCVLYGFGAVVITLGLGGLRDAPLLLFLGSAVIAGLLEWLAGRLLEHFCHRRFWDYSRLRFHLDGYVCLQSAAAWGLLGSAGLGFIHPVLLNLGGLLPRPVLQILLWALMALTILSAVRTYDFLRPVQSANAEKPMLCQLSQAPPAARKSEERPEAVFARGCGFQKLFFLFLLGAFLGDAVETMFCRLTEGVWMSRSSVVLGPFSLVWGLGLALGTRLLYPCRNRSGWTLFFLGALLGGVFEYLCSVFTELAFGKVFWDYSHLPLNLHGRINLLFCLIWGVTAVLWLKWLYPPLSRWIEALPFGPGRFLSGCLVVFMTVNISVSALALTRGRNREAGSPAASSWEWVMDRYYGDAVLTRVYPNAMPAGH